LLTGNSKGISLANTKPEDIDEVINLEQENCHFVFGWTRQQHLAALEDPGIMHLTVRCLGQFVGYMILAGAGSRDLSLEFRRLVIGPKGKGYGRTAIQLLKKMAFEKLRFHRLWLDVYQDNLPAVKLYFDEGFVQEGVLRECKRGENGYRSMLVMSILEHEYYAQREK